ncbi:hypothetical protein KIH39_21450 [Telmatocola sphagniphila]|uniref:Uncharacterized protein n=1 Tax=Telmatocola sphagniphila TaxID=1123043 RepID=A0A8E6B5A9_9BACT|nr:hypothetical protein [Telmatocola sphagniphila]QVL31386.1 hypothetical protein KIH39_21450 [Telmatocola sphagniphila]
MDLLKTAASRGFLTQVVAWGLYYLLELDFLRWLINPGFAASKMAGDTFAVAVILAVNWFIFTMIWVVILLVARSLFTGWSEESLHVPVSDPFRGYHEE